MKRVTNAVAIRAAALATLIWAPAGLHASGFALIEQGASGMGNAFAGAAAVAEDPSTLFFNPAGMTRLDGMQVLLAGHIVRPQSEVKRGSASHPGVPPVSISGSLSGDGRQTKFVPNFYVVNPVSDTVTLGLGINAPFGLTTEYDSDWIGRYHALKSEVEAINVNPSIAFELNKTVSIGAGVNAQYLDAELSSAVDAGLIDVATFSNAFGFSPGNASNDGLSTLTGDSWGWGFNLGALFTIDSRTRLGVAYRSRIEHTVKGIADISLPSGSAVLPGVGNVTFAQAVAASGLRDTRLRADIELPASFSVSLYRELSPEWAVMADWTWTEWSTVPELRIEFDSGLTDNVTTFNWDDTNRYSIGTTYRPGGGEWTFRGGVAYDESPIPNAEHRSPRLPGEDRLWIAVGAGYRLSDAWSFDVGYARLFVDDPQIRKDGTAAEDALRGALSADYDASVDILSAQAVYRF